MTHTVLTSTRLATRFASPSGLALAALLLGLVFPAQAAPSEGTAGQTVTGRSLHRLDSSSRAASPSVMVAAAPTLSHPTWKELSPAQQQSLSPLAAHWDRLTEERKRKWLVISKNYPSLPPAEQLKLHRRMSDWVALSKQQRTQARQNFSEIKKLPAEQKAAEWEAYQALSPEEKRKLATQAPAKPTGLATGKPGASPKLISTPRRATAAGSARMAEIVSPIQPHTLLPRQEPQRKDIERSPYDDEPAE
jgi:hypothetical protein